TPHGRLLLESSEDAAPLSPDLAERIHEAFTRGHGHGLLQLGAAEINTAMPPVFTYWREFGARYVTAVCTMPEAETIAPPAQEDLESIASSAADDGRRISDVRSSRSAVGGDRCRFPVGTLGVEALGPGIPETKKS